MTIKPLEATLKAALDYPIQPTTLVSYHSRGRLLIMGSIEQILEIIPQIHPLMPFVFLTESCNLKKLSKLGGVEIIPGNIETIEINGYLGAFSLNICSQQFDLVLDLQAEPYFDFEVLPPGYYVSGSGPDRLDDILSELPDMVGQFDKPKFFDFEIDKCAHSNSGLVGCRKCIDACATRAIETIDLKITVNPFLCQGCGDCTTVCPAGAINYMYPSRQDTINRIRILLKVFTAAGGQAPVLLLHDLDEDTDSLPCDDHIIPYRLESLGAAGMDIWLSAIAFGVKQVLLFDHGKLTRHTQKILSEQLNTTREILQGMGYSEDLIKMVTKNQILPDLNGINSVQPATYAGDNDKRTMIRSAVDHLFEYAPNKKNSIPLSGNALFGDIQVDKENCTLCMSCVSVCPSGALLAGQDEPVLKLIESSCVQCGLCKTACPENVITLTSQYTYDSIQVRKARILHREEAFHCVQCNKPFATESMINKIRSKLEHHPMFQGENSRRLLMCDECRINDQFNKN